MRSANCCYPSIPASACARSDSASFSRLKNGRQYRRPLLCRSAAARPAPIPFPFPFSQLRGTCYVTIVSVDARPNSKTWMLGGMAIFPHNRKNFPFLARTLSGPPAFSGSPAPTGGPIPSSERGSRFETEDAAEAVVDLVVEIR